MHRRGFVAALLSLAGGCLGGRGSLTPTRSPTASRTATTGPAATRTGTTPAAPLVQFDVAWDADLDAATITHAGGDTLTAATVERLAIVVTTWPDHPIPEDVTLTPTKTPTTWRTTWDAAAGGDAYPIGEGDSVTLDDATPGDEIAVRWHGSGGRADVLERAKLPQVER